MEYARWWRSGWPTSNGSLENLLHPTSLKLDVVPGGRFRAASFGRGREAAVSSARARAGTSSGSTSTPDSAVTNSGGPPNRVATTERLHAIASSSAWPNGSSRAGPQTTAAADNQPGTESCVTRPTTLVPGRPSSDDRSGPSPTKVSDPPSRRENASASLTTFFRPVREPTWTKAGDSSSAALGAASKRSRSTPESTTSVLPRASGSRSQSSRSR